MNKPLIFYLANKKKGSKYSKSGKIKQKKHSDAPNLVTHYRVDVSEALHLRERVHEVSILYANDE